MPKGQRKPRRYTEEDDRYILDHLESSSVRQIAKHLNRLRGSVSARITILKREGRIPERSYLTLSEVARRKHVTADTVYDALHAGSLSATRVDGAWRIPIDAADNWYPRAHRRPERRGTVHINLPDSQVDWLFETARREGVSRSELVRRAVALLQEQEK